MGSREAAVEKTIELLQKKGHSREPSHELDDVVPSQKKIYIIPTHVVDILLNSTYWHKPTSSQQNDEHLDRTLPNTKKKKNSIQTFYQLNKYNVAIKYSFKFILCGGNVQHRFDLCQAKEEQ